MHMITTNAHNHHEKLTKEIFYELECEKKDKKEMPFTRYLVVKGKKFKTCNFQLEEKAFKT